MTCVDLRQRFGDRSRIRREADGATWYATPDAERVWLLELPCRHGVVYPHGDSILAAVVTGRQARRRILALPCLRSRRGDVELVVTFHVDDAEQVLAVLKPKRRRVLSPAQRAAAMAGLAKAQEGRRASRETASQGARIDAAAGNAHGDVSDPLDAGHPATSAAEEPAS